MNPQNHIIAIYYKNSFLHLVSWNAISMVWPIVSILIYTQLSALTHILGETEQGQWWVWVPYSQRHILMTSWWVFCQPPLSFLCLLIPYRSRWGSVHWSRGTPDHEQIKFLFFFFLRKVRNISFFLSRFDSSVYCSFYDATTMYDLYDTRIAFIFIFFCISVKLCLKITTRRRVMIKLT